MGQIYNPGQINKPIDQDLREREEEDNTKTKTTIFSSDFLFFFFLARTRITHAQDMNNHTKLLVLFVSKKLVLQKQAMTPAQLRRKQNHCYYPTNDRARSGEFRLFSLPKYMYKSTTYRNISNIRKQTLKVTFLYKIINL